MKSLYRVQAKSRGREGAKMQMHSGKLATGSALNSHLITNAAAARQTGAWQARGGGSKARRTAGKPAEMTQNAQMKYTYA